MFKQRFFTSVILIILVLIGIFYANDSVLLSIMSVLCAAMAWEWSFLIPIVHKNMKILFIIALLFFILGIHYLFVPSLWMNGVLWLCILWAVVRYPRSGSIWGHVWLMTGVAWFALGLFANTLWALFHQSQGRLLFIYVLNIVWATDIGAYMFGKLWGKHRLIPQVSPGKTVEGSLGGIALGFGVSILGYLYFQPQHASIWFVQAGILIGTAIVGDLWISMLKRRVKMKDTGRILPGHGGILDRLDSLLACLPMFYSLYSGHI